MAALRVYEVRVRILSPTIITRRRTENGFLGPLDYIPAQTLRGAVVSSLFVEGLMDRNRMRAEEEVPTVFSSPAYPVIGGARTYPAHPFAMECKVCAEKGEATLVGELDPRKLEDSLAERRDLELVPVECGSGHRALKPLHPNKFLVLEGGKFSAPKERRGGARTEGGGRASAEKSHSVSVAISRGRAAGIKGMLYHYEFLMPGKEFWATLVLPAELSIPGNGLQLMIGRGVSRGFGRAKMDVVGEVTSSFSGTVKVLYALSPTLGAPEGNSTYPSAIELRDVARRFGLEAERTVRVSMAYGRTIWVSAGWSMVRGEPRPRVLCRAQGSLLLLEEQVEGEASKALSLLRYTGTVTELGGRKVFGFNHLVPLGCM